MKKLVMILLALLMLTQPILAASLPKTIWPVQEKFVAAEKAGNKAETLKQCEALIAIMEKEADSSIKTDYLAGKYDKAAKISEELGLYAKALTYYTKYIPYAEKLGWKDGIKYAQNKKTILTSEVNVYIEDTSYYPPYFSAKFEPKRGVLQGATYDDDSRISTIGTAEITNVFGKKNSSYLLYLNFNEEIGVTLLNHIKDAQKTDTVVTLAWNAVTPLADYMKYDAYIKSTIDTLAATGAKIFLRFSGEMNVGPNGTDAKAYIESYKYVANYAKTKSNIAMVWSPNDIASVSRPFKDFYPGDAYVDWVGVSMYTNKYFQGKKDTTAVGESNNTAFLTGEYANPLSKIKPIVDFMSTNNIKKPIMISEGGVSHFIAKENEDATDWAITQLGKMYAELIRKYPQIKLINYFNTHMEQEHSYYHLYQNDKLSKALNNQIASPYFLSNASETATTGFKPFTGGKTANNIKLSTVALVPKIAQTLVTYTMDGKKLEAMTKSPYEVNITNINNGKHVLIVDVYDMSNKKLATKTINFEVGNTIAPTPSQSIKIKVNGELVKIEGQQPVIIDTKTLVPARDVFEKIGATVEWVNETKQIIVKSDKYDIRLIIGSKTMTVNGKETVMEVPAQIINGKTLIPIRAVAEAMDAQVGWSQAEMTATITTK